MYSPEFMKYLINYQSSEENKKPEKQVKYFSLGGKHNKLASVLLLNKK